MFPETIHLQYIRYPKVGKQSCLFKVGAKVSWTTFVEPENLDSCKASGCDTLLSGHNKPLYDLVPTARLETSRALIFSRFMDRKILFF